MIKLNYFFFNSFSQLAFQILRKPTNIVFLGDSIFQYGDKTNGFISLLRQFYVSKVLITNLGISGINSRQLLEFLNNPLYSNQIPQNPEYIFCQIGSNDAAYKIEKYEKQGIEINQFRQYVKDIINKLIQTYQSSKICLITPPPVSNYLGRNHQQTEEYVKVYKQLFEEMKKENDNLYLLDIRNMLNEEQLQKIQIDGLHFNDMGNKTYFDMITQFLGEIPYYVLHWTQMK